jgi:hypothetical protein
MMQAGTVSEMANMADHPRKINCIHHCENFPSYVSSEYTRLHKSKKIYKEVSIMKTQTITMKHI